jgi:hypothetical protein
MSNNCGLPLELFDHIAWELTGKAIDSVSIVRLLSILKFTSSEWSTGNKQSSYWKKNDECPFCLCREDMKHVFTCNHVDAFKARQKAFTYTSTHLRKLCPTLGQRWATLIHMEITNLGRKIHDHHENSNLPDNIIQDQNTLGWLHLLQGRLRKSLWNHMQRGDGATMGPIAIRATW